MGPARVSAMGWDLLTWPGLRAVLGLSSPPAQGPRTQGDPAPTSPYPGGWGSFLWGLGLSLARPMTVLASPPVLRAEQGLS